MAKTSKNLGLVQAIHVGTTAPANTAMIWYKLGDNLHYYFDIVSETWVQLKAADIPLGSGNIYTIDGALTGARIVDLATYVLAFTGGKVGFGVVPVTEIIEVEGNIKVAGQVYSDVPATMVPTGTTQIIDFNNGNGQILDLASATGNVTLTFSNPKAGASYLLKVIQDATTPRNLVYPAAVKWAGGTAPTISVGASAVDIIVLFFDGVSYCASITQDLS